MEAGQTPTSNPPNQDGFLGTKCSPRDFTKAKMPETQGLPSAGLASAVEEKPELGDTISLAQ